MASLKNKLDHLSGWARIKLVLLIMWVIATSTVAYFLYQNKVENDTTNLYPYIMENTLNQDTAELYRGTKNELYLKGIISRIDFETYNTMPESAYERDSKILAAKIQFSSTYDFAPSTLRFEVAESVRNSYSKAQKYLKQKKRKIMTTLSEQYLTLTLGGILLFVVIEAVYLWIRNGFKKT